MRRRLVWIAAAVIVAAGGFALHAYMLDGLDGLVLSAVYGDDATYAPGYSDARFRRVRIGMWRDDVERLLGRPIIESYIYERDREDATIVDADAGGHIVAVRHGGRADARGIVGPDMPSVVERLG